MDKEFLRAFLASQFLMNFDKGSKNLLLREKCKLAVRMTDILFEELSKQEVKTPDLNSILSKEVRSFSDLSIRAKNCLRSSDIYTIGELVTYSKSDLQKMRNMGEITIKHIESFLDRYGLYLGMSFKQ